VQWVHTTDEVPGPPPATLPDSRRYRHHADDPVALLHSSGTTGVPKPTIHTHRSIVSGPKFRLVDHRETPQALTLTALPQSHLGCIACTTYAVLSGARTIAGYDHPGADLTKTVAEHRPTAVMSFAHAYAELAAVDLPPGAVDSVNAWVSIGDAVHEAHIKRLLGQRGKDLPPAAFLDRLGTTELGWGVLLKTRTLDTERNDRCAGRPVGVAEVTILREDGTPADDNEIGYLAAKGPAITPGYWNNPDLTYRFKLAGYWVTGDNAYRDENGDFFLVDRAVDAIYTEQGTGYSVFMEEVILADVPDVVDCAVVAGRYDGRVVPVAVVTVAAPRSSRKNCCGRPTRRCGWPATRRSACWRSAASPRTCRSASPGRCSSATSGTSTPTWPPTCATPTRATSRPSDRGIDRADEQAGDARHGVGRKLAVPTGQ
jgi:acyl-coenzyme A synthetase/AMP-(fatty) acid ligase